MNTWWFEHGMILHSEFRDGNVPAGYEQLRVFKEESDSEKTRQRKLPYVRYKLFDIFAKKI